MTNSEQTAQPSTDLPPAETIRRLLERLEPGSTLHAISPCPGSYSNFTHLVEAHTPDGALWRIVVRRYAVFGEYDRGQKAHREFHTLQLLARYGVPVPPPLYLDETGTILGIPGIVTGYVPGAQVETPLIPWTRTLAAMLAAIHSVPCDAETQGFLLDANREATWFMQGNEVPPYIAIHPAGAQLWHLARASWPTLQPTPPTLVHLDYWLGNILWEEEHLSAVVDWEEAAYGDPAIDVAYCRMDLVLRGLHDLADLFLDAYETATGGPVANLGFWQLAAAARPLFSPAGWISDSPATERFEQFLLDTRQRLAASEQL